MTFYAFGLNHTTAPIAVREAFALGETALVSIYRTTSLNDEAELLLLSTCNRTEVFLLGTLDDVASVQEAVARHTRRAWPGEQAFFLQDESAILHLLRVTAGLESMVLGDAQILVQVKDAYRLAVDEEHVGTVLHRLLHTAFRTAKRVITETQLAGGAATVSSAAVALARRHFEGASLERLAGLEVLLVGAGQMGRLALVALTAHADVSVTVTNRSPDRARGLAEAYGARVVAWADRYAAVASADLVVVASGAAEPVLRSASMPERDGSPVLVVDIGMPRNVEPSVDTLPGYTVIDLDDLDAEVRRVTARRGIEVPAAERICEESLGEYVSWVFHHQALQPAIQAIRETFEGIRLQEIERHHGRFSAVDREELDRLTTSIIQKVLAVPVVRLKSVEPDSIDFVRGIKLLHALFSRPECEDDSITPATTADVRTMSLAPESAFECPFEPDAGADPGEQLRDALRTSSGRGPA